MSEPSILLKDVVLENGSRADVKIADGIFRSIGPANGTETAEDSSRTIVLNKTAFDYQFATVIDCI